MFKNYDEKKFLSAMYLWTISMFNFMTGLFFITADPRISSPTYGKMQELMPLPVYGIFMLVSACLIFSAVFAVNTTRYIFMILGGFLGAISIGLYASASTLGGVNLMLPSRYSLISVSCLIIAVAGGFELWKIKKTMSQN